MILPYFLYRAAQTKTPEHPVDRPANEQQPTNTNLTPQQQQILARAIERANAGQHQERTHQQLER